MEPEPIPVTVREAQPSDIPAIQQIYAHHVLQGLGSFEEVAPDEAEMRHRMEGIKARGLPYLVAQDAAGRILGFAYAGPFRPRSAYRYLLEDSVYILPELTGRGIGRALLNEVINRCAALGYRKMVAVVGDSSNHASISMHQKCGFEIAGILKSAGFKLGRWVDSVLMHRFIGEGDTTLPAEKQ